MFHSARIKLTAWYLFIIMLICIVFSVIVYNVLMREVILLAQQQRIRFERRIQDEQFLPNPRVLIYQQDNDSDSELIEDAQNHIINMLVGTDLSILALAGIASYFLAGRTLQPIKVMVNEQRRFIGDASHELRTPLTSLKSAMEVHLRDKALTVKETRLLLAESIGEVNKLQSLSDQLLQLTQYEQPNGHTPMQKVSLKRLIQQVVKKFATIAKQKDIRIVSKVDSFNVMAYEKHLSDICDILLDNAIKYSPAHSTVTVKTTKSNASLQIACINKGPGIAAKDIPHIFDRFYRTDAARTKSAANGYGLGLSIAQSIVRLYNGTISVRSTPNKETTFTVVLPVKILA